MLRLPRVVVAIVVALAFVFTAVPCVDASPKGPKTVKVKEYKRKDGTKVHSYKRSAPRAKAPKAPKTSKPKKSRSFAAPVYYDGAHYPRQSGERSSTAKSAFMRQSGFPDGRPGYVVDHIIPLACGGADMPYNMQWQTVAEAKTKDKVERRNCH